MNCIHIRNLAFAYGQTPVLQDLSLDIEEGSFCGVIGPNGAGKSTLLKLLAGQLTPSVGRIVIGEMEIHRKSEKTIAEIIATVPQESTPVFGFKVSEMVMMARFIRQNRFLFEKDDDWMAVEAALKETNIVHLADRPITNLSGGERQRVYLARALAQETPVLLLDEPASHLDLKHQVRVYDLLKRLQHQKGKTIIMVTHDLNLASQYCDTILLLGKNGKVFFGSVSEVLQKETIEGIYDIECNVVGSDGFNFFLPAGNWMKKNRSNER